MKKKELNNVYYYGSKEASAPEPEPFSTSFALRTPTWPALMPAVPIARRPALGAAFHR